MGKYKPMTTVTAVSVSDFIDALDNDTRKTNLAIYVADFPGKDALLAKLGKHKGGDQQCLYINKLADVDLDCLKEIIRQSLVVLRKKWTVTAS